MSPASTAGLRQNRNFAKFWFGETVSLFGVRVTFLALPLTAVLVLGANVQQLGLLWFVFFLPYLVVALPFGLLIDRRPKRPLMIIANIARASLVGLVPLLAVLDLLTMPALLGITFGIGVATVLFEICLQSYVPLIVAREHLVAANGRVGASMSAAESAGPGVGGLLVQLLTAPFALVANAVSYLVSVWSLWSIRVSEPPPAKTGRNIRREIADGLRFIIRDPYLRPVMIGGAAYNFFYVFNEALFVIFAVHILHFSPGLIGLVMALGAVGGVLGAAIASSLVRRFPFGRVYLAGELVSVCGPVLVAAASGPMVVAAVLVTTGFFLRHSGSALGNAASMTLRQTVTPTELLGRMNAGMRMIMWGPQTVGALAAGLIGGLIGIRAGLWVAAVGTLLSALPIALSRIPRLRELASIAPIPERPEPAGTELASVRITSYVADRPEREAPVRLHTSENPYGASPGVRTALSRQLGAIHRYPDGPADDLVAAIARHHGAQLDQVSVGNGVDEIILLIAMSMHDADRPWIVTEATFPSYLESLRATRAKITTCPLRGYRLPVADIAGELAGGARGAFVCNPHNPTGSVITKTDLEYLGAAAARGGGVLVVDEAYAEFAGSDFASALPISRTSDHVLVLRTFSKAYGLAGLRAGYAIGPAALIAQVAAVHRALPYHVNRLAQTAAITALGDQHFVRRTTRAIGHTRDWLRSELIALGLTCPASKANFLLVDFGADAQRVVAHLSGHGVLVRDTGDLGLPGHVRISIGTPTQMRDVQRLIADHLASAGTGLAA